MAWDRVLEITLELDRRAWVFVLLSRQSTIPPKLPFGLGVPLVAESRDTMLNWIGRLLCRFGFHDYRLIEVVLAFGGSGQVQKVECRRCGYATTRSG